MMKVEIAATLATRLRGLAGRYGSECVLALVPCNDVHTYTMKSAIDVAFVSDRGIVLEVHEGVPPGRRLKNKKAVMTLERYTCPSPWLTAGDVLELSFGKTRCGEGVAR